MDDHTRGLEEFRKMIVMQEMADKMAKRIENEMRGILGDDYTRSYGVLRPLTKGTG